MTRIPIVAAVVLAWPTVGARAQAVAPDVAAVAAAEAEDIARVRDRYLTAAAERDAGTIAELFADDAVLMPAERVVIRGRREIARYFSAAFDRPGSSPTVTITCTSTESRDGFGSETGCFEEQATVASGTVARVSGVYVIIYRRDASGRWRIALEVRSRGQQTALGNW